MSAKINKHIKKCINMCKCIHKYPCNKTSFQQKKAIVQTNAFQASTSDEVNASQEPRMKKIIKWFAKDSLQLM